jgi:hypothetical protein
MDGPRREHQRKFSVRSCHLRSAVTFARDTAIMFVTRLLRRYLAAHVHVVHSSDGCEYLISFDQMGLMPVVVTRVDAGVSTLAPLVRTDEPVVVTTVPNGLSVTEFGTGPRPALAAAH